MKYFLYILMGLALLSIIFNATFLNLDNLLEGDSKTAIITILASACVLVIIWILLISKTIEKKYQELQ